MVWDLIKTVGSVRKGPLSPLSSRESLLAFGTENTNHEEKINKTLRLSLAYFAPFLIFLLLITCPQRKAARARPSLSPPLLRDARLDPVHAGPPPLGGSTPHRRSWTPPALPAPLTLPATALPSPLSSAFVLLPRDPPEHRGRAPCVGPRTPESSRGDAEFGLLAPKALNGLASLFAPFRS